jgi:hypothetical protein
MTDSKKKAPNGSRSKTKAQLELELTRAQAQLKNQETELAACKKELREAQATVKNLQQFREAAEDVGKMERLEQENEVLGKQIQEAEDQAAHHVAEADMKLRKSEQQIQELKKEIKALQEKIADYEKQSPIEKEPREEIEEDLAASKATFIIHLYPRQGNYHGKIGHPLTRDKSVLSGLNKDAIFAFISKHLPQQEEEDISAKKAGLRIPSEDVSTPFEPDAPKKEEVLQEIRFQQLDRLVEPGQPLRARLPFKMYTRLHFPVTPTTENMDVATSSYVVRLLAKDADDKKVVARNGAADMMSVGKADYENTIMMSRLDPGKYLLEIYTIAPYANIKESKHVELMMQ